MIKMNTDTKRALGIIAIIVIAYFVFTSGMLPAYQAARDNINVTSELDSMQLQKDLKGYESLTSYYDFQAGTIWGLSGTSSRLEPDHADKGLPDLQISMSDFGVSSKDKERSYSYTDSSGIKHDAKATRHYVTMTIRIEIEGKMTIGDTWDETEAYFYEDMLLYVSLTATSGVIALDNGQVVSVEEAGNYYGDVNLDNSWANAENPIPIVSLSGDPTAQGLSTNARFSVHINKAVCHFGGGSYTAQINVKVPLSLVTSKVQEVTPDPTPTPTPTPDDNGGADNGGFEALGIDLTLIALLVVLFSVAFIFVMVVIMKVSKGR